MARKISVEIVGDSSKLERSFTRSAHAAGIWNSEIVRASRGAIAATVGFSGLGRALAFASGAFVGVAGVSTAIKSSTSAFVQFQDQMQKTVGLADIAGKSVAGFSKQILNLAPEVGVGPQELARAFYFIASSGISASKSMDVLEASAKASVSGLGDVQTVADAVTSAINAYGEANLSAQSATDVLVASVRQGKGEADVLAGSIGNVSALAAQMGVSFNDVGAALAAMTRLGTDARTSTIQLQQLFTNLLKVTPQAAKAFKSVGLSAGELRDTFTQQGLLAGLKKIKDAFGDNTTVLAKAFPDVRALRGVLALVGKQAGSTAEIFKQMADTTGSLDTAFNAVSKDVAQKFREFQASAEVAKIALGSLFAPLAGSIADALRSASESFTSFVQHIQAQTTITGKLNVVWTGIKDTARGATSAIASAVKDIDWVAVWSHAKGIADGLQKQLEGVNWGGVGAAIGNGIAKGIAGATVAIKELAKRIEKAIGTIDFVDLGKKAGPGLAAAVVTAFATLTDPAFWAHNWKLALSVAVVAFGGGIGEAAGRIGVRMSIALERVFLRVVESIGESIGHLSFRLGDAFLSLFEKLPVIPAIQRLTSLVRGAFGRLGKLTRFAIKVIGVQTAITAIQNFVGRAAHFIGHGLDVAWNEMKKSAIKAALGIIEPFTHLPNFLGGGPFKRMRDALHKQLDGMVKDSATAAKNISDNLAQTGTFFQSIIQAINALAGVKPAAFAHAGGGGFKGGGKDAAGFTPPKIKTTSSSDTAGVAKAVQTFTLPFKLQLEQAKAALTKSTVDDVKAAKDVAAFIRSKLPKLKGQKLLGALGDLATALQTIRDDAKKAAGFTVPIKFQVEQAKLDALGKPITSILKKIRAAAESALKSGKLGFQGQLDAWNTIKDVNDQLKNAAQDALSGLRHIDTKKLVQGLGLTAEQIRQIRARANSSNVANGQFVSGGAFGVPVDGGGSTTVNLNVDGQRMAKVVTKHQKRTQRRNPQQRRGFAGSF